MNKFAAFLNSIVPLSGKAIEDLEDNIVSFSLKKNEILLREGQVCRYLYFVESGLLRQYYINQEKEITDYFAYENKIASGISSLFSRTASRKFIEALEPSLLLAISIDKLESLFYKHHEIERVGRLIATDAFIMMEQRIYSLQFSPAKDRYDIFLKLNPNLLLRAPLGHVASYLGITQVTLSRIRGDL